MALRRNAMSLPKTEKIWHNGKFIAWDDAKIHVLSHVVNYGSGVFEGIRCYDTANGPAIFRLREHLERLFASAKFYEMKIPYTLEELDAACREVVRKNGFRACYVRPICFFGSSVLSVHPRNCPVETAIFAWPWGAYLGAKGEEHGARICVSPWRKFHPSMMPTMAKACGQST